LSPDPDGVDDDENRNRSTAPPTTSATVDAATRHDLHDIIVVVIMVTVDVLSDGLSADGWMD
jgi:hypothetical protein